MKNNWKAFTAETKTTPGFFIRRAQRRLGFGGDAARQTHVGLLNKRTGTIYEALGSGIELTDLQHYLDEGIKINFLEKLELAEDVGEKAVKFSKADGNQREYDFFLIFGLLLFSIGLPKKVLKFFNKKEDYICTEYLSNVVGEKLFLPAAFYEKYF